MIAPAEPVAVPLPALHEVMLTKYFTRSASLFIKVFLEFWGRILGISEGCNEIRTLFLINRQNRPFTPPITTTFPEPSISSQTQYHYYVSQPTSQRAQAARLEGNGSAHTYSYGPVSRPYATRGWIEHALPHSTTYLNPHIQATTNVDLRNSVI
ncbi:hypothetical protein M405DRAFT_880599, partial [Rhizopogon salebrosus TDB-379]